MITVELQKKNVQKETTLFYRFLNHPNFPTHRKMIFSAFPKLQKDIEDKKDISEEKNVEEFIKNFYQRNSNKIDEIIKISESVIKQKTPVCFEKLSELMNFKDDIKVNIYITILPFSPFSENGFFYSILGELNNKKRLGVEYDIAFLSVHEISHIILHRIIKEEGLDVGSWLLSHYLQEILAPVLMKQEPIKSILKITDYSGNPNLNYLYINYRGNEKKLLVDFIKDNLDTSIEKGNGFSIFLNETIKILKMIEPEIKEKHDLWNKYGGKIKDEKDIFEQYKKPIKIGL